MNKTLVRIFDIVLIVFAAIGLLFSSVWVYHKITDKDLYTDFVATYASSVTDKMTGEKLPVMEAQYFENYNNTGKEVIEFKINCYTDPTMPTVMQKGFQLVKDGKKQTLYYADGYHGVSLPSLHPYNETNDEGQLKEGFFISINNGKEDKVYGIRMDGSFQKENRTRKWWSYTAPTRFFGHLFSGNWKGSAEYKISYDTIYYTMEEFMVELGKSIKGCSYGTGKCSLPLVDMGKFWHVYEVSEDGKMSDKPIGNNAGNVLSNSYFSIDISYSRRGITYAGQSMFGSVAGDSNYNLTGIDFDVDYNRANIVYSLSENDFDKRYSSADSGFYYALNEKKLNELKTYTGIEINVNFNISKLKNVNVLGFDYYALNGLQIKSLTISSDKQRDFNLLYGCLEKTGLKVEDIKTSNVNIVDLGGNMGVVE